MAVPPEILRLIERYEAQREAYQSGQYKETQIRVEFIDPFFKALGWDVANEHGYAEAYKDVIHEDALKIGGATEAPDACFRIGGVRKFFVECKKPSVNIKDDVHPAYQLRRYGWSAKLPLSILTDFHEWAVYDCRLKPNPRDTAAVARIMYLTADQYPAKWDELAAIFSREAVLTGSFDKFVESTKGKRGTASVDDAFLEEIERWRDLLARTIALRNPALSQRELNFAVQRIIDRIIFLRICEDRGIEPYGRLMTLKNGERVYPRLCEFFQRADERYNSGIFCFTKNKTAVEPPDELTLTLKIDDKIIQDIVGNLYYPESPYEFSVLSSDILGQVYERFLGKVIRLTAGHQAKVEEKPEVRKAGGVYYTPTFIVDYIVKNTVGKLLEGKTPKQAAKLKILDPACGSGSFLIGAYQYLLDWHRDYYVKQIVDAASSRVPKRQDAASAIILPKYFDPEEPVANLSGNLPHWRQARATYFITFRCADSLPQSKLEQWEKEREEWLCRNPEPHSSKQRTEYYEQFVEKLQTWLDSGDGACRLADQRAKAIVEDALKFFDGQRYRLGEFAVMPNHVHVLVTPSGEYTLSDILHSWKSFTANKVNELFNAAGEFWQKESFDHIVRNADQLGRIQIYIKENPKRLEASSTTIVDAASSRVPKRQDAASTLKPPIYQVAGGDYRLTTEERKRILLNNIYGVDIDSQAVEVTKLSLLLKVLEGESQETITKQFELFNQRALPDLGSNIKCGNSLIGPDFYQQQEMALFNEEERLRINVFDWQAEFPEVFGVHANADVDVDAASSPGRSAPAEPGSRVPNRQDAASTLGFDAVIGNPPYLNIDNVWGKGDPRLQAIKIAYPDVYNDKTDLLFYFLAKGIHLSRQRTCFIISRAFLEAFKADKLRAFLINNADVEEIIDFQNIYVFKGIGITTCIISFVRKSRSTSARVYKAIHDQLPQQVLDKSLRDTNLFQVLEETNTNLGSGPWSFVPGNVRQLNKKIDSVGEPLGQVLVVGQGMQTGLNEVFGQRTQQEIKAWKMPNGTYYMRATNSDIQRYYIQNRNEFMIYIEDLADFEELPPRLRDYLKCHETELKKRAAFQRGNCAWWKYTWPLHKQYYDRKRILCPYLSSKNRFALDESNTFLPLTDTTVLFENNQPESLFYLTGLLNSKLLTFRFRSIGKLKSNGIVEYFWNSLSRLAIRRIDFSNPADKTLHDRMVALVEQMLALHKQLAAAKTPQEQTALSRQIAATDAQIDRLVYELYGLTAEEIKIVEG